jgi:hypothetical protein
MMQTVLALFLSAMIGLASVTMAVARGQAAGMSQITICSGYGVVSITLDAEGNPVGPVHPCPDCLAGGMAVLTDPLTRACAPLGQADALEGAVLPSVAGAFVLSATARGPPARF